MNNEQRNTRQAVHRFLERLGEPVSDEQSSVSTSRVLDKLRAEDIRVVSFSPDRTISRQRVPVWGAVAACAVVIVAGGLLHLLVQQTAIAETVAKPVSGEIHTVGMSPAFFKYSRIEEGKAVKAGSEGGAIALVDGSQIQMSPDAVLSVIREADGLRVRLNSGIVLVEAASQRAGNLYVETMDCVVSVRGTVFAVSAEEGGSRVSVLEGEVQVQSGEVSRTLLAGQQTSTVPETAPLTAQAAPALQVAEVIARVQQPAPPVSQPTLPAGTTVIRGVIKTGSGVGIPDVTVTLCPTAAAPVGRQAETPTTTAAPFDDIVYLEPGKDASVLKNRAYFSRLFSSGTVPCPSPNLVTDPTGRFEFSNVLPGEYIIRAEREGFSEASGVSPNSGDGGGARRLYHYYAIGLQTGPAVRQLSGASMRLTVAVQQPSPEVSLILIQAGVIAGRVRDANGRPAVNAQVRVVPISQGNTGDAWSVISTMTNDLGEYRAYWLLPGEYRIVASANGRPASETWFPRGVAAAEGNTVAIREGETVSSIDIVLRPGEDTPVVPGVRFAPDQRLR